MITYYVMKTINVMAYIDLCPYEINLAKILWEIDIKVLRYYIDMACQSNGKTHITVIVCNQKIEMACHYLFK